MKISKPIRIVAAVALLAAAGGGAWLYLSVEQDTGQAPGAVAQKKAPARSPTGTAKNGAKPIPSDPDEVIKAVIEESGVQQYLLDVRQQALKNAEASAKGQPGAPDIKSMRVAIERTFDPEKLTADLAVNLKQNYDAERMPRFLELLRQPVAAKMNALEAQQPVQQAVEQYFEGLKKSPPSLDRQQLIQRVDESSRASESAAELTVLMIRNMVQAAQAANTRSPARMSRQDLDRSLETLRGDMSTQSRNMHHFIYRQASDADLNEYVKLLSSDIGKWGTLALNNGMRAVVDARGKDLGTAVAQLAPVASAALAKDETPAVRPGEAKAAVPEETTATDARKAEAQDKDKDKAAQDGVKAEAQSEQAKPRAAAPTPDTPLGMVASTNEAEAKHAKAERPEPKRLPARQLFSRHNDLLTATIMMDHASMMELLAFGKSPNIRQPNGYTPLMIAAAYGDVEGVRLLVTKGADLNQRLTGGETALTMARSRGKAEVAALLESYGAQR
jgi:hypothetical protein